MIDSLEKYNSLPQEIKDKVSTDEVFDAVEDLEKKYEISLSSLIMRVMVKEFPFSDLAKILEEEFKLDEVKAATLEAELRSQVFKNVLDYLSPGKNYSPAAVETKIEEPIAIEKPDSDSGAPGRNFLQEDEKDVSGFHEKVAALPPKTFDLTAAADEVARSSGLAFASSELAGRLRNIILTYLKGVRTKAETRENLTKSALSGGLSLEEAEADRVFAAAQKKKDEGGILTPPAKKNVFAFSEEEAKAAGGDKKAPPLVEYDLAAELKKKSSSAEVPPLAKAPSFAQAFPSAEAMEDKPESKIENKPQAKIEEPKKVAEKTASTEDDVDIPKKKEASRTPAPRGNKKKMDDIGAPQVMSPIDELAYMDLIVFRRLGNSAPKIAGKVKSIVDLLAKEGIDKQIEGIKAWRRSPVNRTYLSMGQESIDEGKNIEAVIADRKAKNLNYLTREEFEAIMDLNNKLRF